MPDKKDAIARLRPNWKLWLEDDGEYVFGPGAFAILRSIQEKGTIRAGATSLGMSYRYAWGVIRKIERKIGMRLVETHRGGPAGGGTAVVTDTGLALLEKYALLKKAFEIAAGELSPDDARAP